MVGEMPPMAPTSTPAPAAVAQAAIKQVVVAGDRVFVPVGVTTPVALDADTGREAARGARGVDCGGMVVHGGSVLCSAAQDGGIAVLDARTLRLERTLGAGLEITGDPAVNADGTVAVLSAGTVDGEVVTYDLASGRELRRAAVGAFDRFASRVYFAGDRLVVASKKEVRSLPASGPVGERDVERFDAVLPDGVDAEALVPYEELIAGGALFLPFDNLVVSGYLP